MWNPFAGKQVSCSPPFCLDFRSSKAFTTFVLGYAVFADQFIFTSFLPIATIALNDRIEVDANKVQTWLSALLAIYGLAMFISCPVFGWWTDRTSSRRAPFLLGIAVNTASTIILWLTHNLAIAIFGRVLQGMAGAIVSVTTMAIMVDTVGQEEIGQYMGFITIALNVGTLLGPICGGVIYEHAGYDSVYIVCLVVLIVDFLLRMVMIERTDTAKGQVEGQARRQSLDEEAGITRGPTAMGEENSTSASAEQPITPNEKPPSKSGRPAVITLLCSPRFLAALWGICMLAIVGDAFKTSLPTFGGDCFGYKSTGLGLIFLPLALPALLGPLFGRLTDRFGTRWLAVAGFLALSPCLILLRLVSHKGFWPQVLLAGLLLLIGLWMTVVLEPLMAEVTYVVTKHDKAKTKQLGKQIGSYAQAYGLFNAAWSAGNTAGPVWAGLIMESKGWKAMSLSVGIVTGLSAVPVLLLCGGWIGKRQPQVEVAPNEK